MVHFENDYTCGAHPEVLQALIETNMEGCTGYGTDRFCEEAKEKIREACRCPDAQVYLLVGGTQTNGLALRSLLGSHEAVVCVPDGHINTHEAGTVEYSGHKVIALPDEDGKMVPRTLAEYLHHFFTEERLDHSVWPGAVYISHPTECGTLYTKQELQQLRIICDQYEIPLYLDGARLGYGLAARDTDVTLPDIAALCDVFYIGGTKLGTLCGEALVFSRRKPIRGFAPMIKQHGALMAKGRVLGVQFRALFTNDLYGRIGRHAIDLAMQLKQGVLEKGYKLFLNSTTNQQFVVLDNETLNRIREQIVCETWAIVDESHTAVRFATSWSTTQQEVDTLLSLL